jgi:hypothetical protein
MPDALIIPIAALPPGTPLTSHDTPVFEEPVTLAENPTELPKRTEAEPGVTLTVTLGGAGEPGALETAAPPPAQAAAHQPTAMARNNVSRRRRVKSGLAVVFA